MNVLSLYSIIKLINDSIIIVSSRRHANGYETRALPLEYEISYNICLWIWNTNSFLMWLCKMIKIYFYFMDCTLTIHFETALVLVQYLFLILLRVIYNCNDFCCYCCRSIRRCNHSDNGVQIFGVSSIGIPIFYGDNNIAVVRHSRS